MNELISIIIPVYNVGEFLPMCLESVCQQTYENIEIIAVNDGSTDDSLRILKKFAEKDSRIKIIDEINHGVSAARNIGLKNASGQYIMFVDGDDWIDVQTCAVAKQTLISCDSDIIMWPYCREYTSSSKPVFFYGNEQITWRGEQVKEVFQRLVGLDGEQLKNPQMVDSFVTAWGKLYKRDIIGDTQFVDMVKVGAEDTLFNIQVFCNAKCITYLPETYSHYRKTNADSLTHSYKNELVFQWEELYRRINACLDEIGADQKLYGVLYNRISLGLIGLGLNLIDDKKLSYRDKRLELKKILNMPQYTRSLAKLPIKYLPMHWKIFFLCAKHKFVIGMYFLLILMNYLRGR